MVFISTGLSSHKVCPTILRDAFNCAEFVDRVAGGELIEVLHPKYAAGRRAGSLAGTHPRMAQYQTHDGTVLAKVFYYTDAAGQIAGSGKHDPKWLRSGAGALIPYEKGHDCPACRTRP